MSEKPTYEELEKRIIQLEAEQNRYSQVEVELKRSLRFTESLLSAIPTPIFFKDAQGRYQGCNPAFTKIASDNLTISLQSKASLRKIASNMQAQR